MEKSIDPIGIFDSGIGGLTVAQAIAKALPLEAITYLGDRARCPYGDRSSAEVARFSLEIGEYLVGLGVKCLVVACNTATAVALPLLREALPIPVVGVIEPGARAAVQASETGRIGVIGTSVTIASHAYRQSIHAISPDAHVVEHACPAFVPLVEAGRFNGPEVEQAVRASGESHLIGRRNGRIRRQSASREAGGQQRCFGSKV
jgi:glutamate racemase